MFRHSTSSHKLQQLLESTHLGEQYLLAKTAQWAQSERTSGMLSELTCGAQVYKPKAADVIIMRDYVHGKKVKEATLRYGHVGHAQEGAQGQGGQGGAQRGQEGGRQGERGIAHSLCDGRDSGGVETGQVEL